MTRARDIANVITNADLAGDIDVDGTANLDVVDIDGAVDMASTLTVAGALSQDGGAVFNEAGASVDFRVEGDTDTNALFVDASADRVGIGESAPASKLEITHGVNSGGLLRLNDSDAGNLGGYMQFDSNGTNKANIQNANNAGIHVNVGTGGSVVFTNLGYTAANALNDFEEGTFTPAYSATGSTFSQYSAQQGNYTKIGNRVCFTIYLQLDGSNSFTGNNLSITGLPFAPNHAMYYKILGRYLNYSADSGYYDACILMSAGSTTVAVRQLGDNVPGTTIAANSLSNVSGQIWLTGTYATDS